MTTYIDEQPGWPKFRWSEEKIAAQLTRVRHRQGRLIGRLEGLGFQFKAEAFLQTLTEEVIKSSEIEGEILDREQVRSSIARRLGMDFGALTPADRNVEGVVEMMIDATQKYAEPLTVERLDAWHASHFPTGRSGMTRIAVSRWRDDKSGPMQVVSGPMSRERIHHQAPAAKHLHREMRAFLKWFNGRPGPDEVLKAALAHLWFVTVHPFDDGNGRIARTIADMALARSEQTAQHFYSTSAQIRLERKAYYDILEATRKGTLVVTLRLRWFLECLDRAFTRADDILASVFRKARLWDRRAATPFNARQREIINRPFNRFIGKLTLSKWAKIAKCSQDNALRDIDDLVKRGILAKDAAGGRSASYSLAEEA
jgi:Fic family protein